MENENITENQGVLFVHLLRFDKKALSVSKIVFVQRRL